MPQVTIVDWDNASTPVSDYLVMAAKSNGTAPMTLEDAMEMKSRTGEKYGDIESDLLVSMATAIANAKTHKPEHDAKLLAIQLILKDRNEHKTE